jgi:PAS domain-containing protein
VQWVVWPILNPRAWSLLYVAVYLSSWFGGLRSGLAATALPTLSGWYFFIPFERSFVVERAGDALSIGIFILIGLLFSFLPDRLRRANERAAAAATSLQVANEQLETRVRERTEEVERIHTELREDIDTLKKIISTQDEISGGWSGLDTQMNLLVRRSQELTNADGAALEQLEGNTLVYRVASGIAAQHVGLRLGRTSSLSGECLRTGETLTCDDTETDWRVDLAACRKVGLRSMLVMPLRPKGEGPKGVLKVLSQRPGAFGAREVRTLQLMGALFVTAMSLAARRKSEEQLRESEHRFRLLADSAPVLIWVNGPDGREFVNRPYLEFLGVATEVEVRGYDWAQFLHPEDRESYVTAYLDSMKKRAAIRGTIPIPPPRRRVSQDEVLRGSALR